jgi:hypothetical protein
MNSIDLIRDNLTKSRDRVLARVEEMRAHGTVLFGTYRRCLQYAADHWYMHRGQLADARRTAGLERMWV